MTIQLIADKRAVMAEVAVTTSYTGAKMINSDADAPGRISTIDEDVQHLERFWDESRSDICQELIGLVEDESEDAKGGYRLLLDVSHSFDPALLPSMQSSLFSFFVMSITAKWYAYTNKQEANDYLDKAEAYLDDVHRKAVYKKKPVRPTYN